MDEKIQSIYFLLENRAINSALMNIESFARENNEGEIGDEAHQLFVSYNMMLSYTLKGIKDPDMQNMIAKIIAHAYNIIDRIKENVKIKSSDSYISKTYKSVISEDISFDKIKKKLEMYTENMSTADLLYRADEIDIKKSEIAKVHEEIVNYMFNKIFVSVKWNETEFKQVQNILNSLLVIDEDKAILISAVTISLLHVFDDKKFMLLLSSCRDDKILISTRALVGLIIILQINHKVVNYYPEILAQLSMLKDDKRVAKEIRNIQLQLLMALETSNIEKKMSEEIIPEVMRGTDKIKIRKITDNPDDIESENPDWEKIIYNQDFTDKIKEMNELQTSGADIYMSTFSLLKNYHFFFKISHWFYPFYKYQYDVFPTISAMKSEKIPFFNVILNSVFFCNSDKYSLCFTFLNIPSSQKNMFINQFSEMNEAEVDEKELMKAFSLESKNSDVISRQYIQDLYRFFKLWHHKSEEKDIFTNKFDLWNNPFLSDIVNDKATLKKAGAFLLQYNHLDEALQIYKKLNDSNPEDTESWQRSGFIHQKKSNFVEAINCYLRADMLSPDQRWTNHHLAKCYKKIGDYTKAIAYYRRIEDLDPEDLSIIIQIGQCYIKAEDYKEAMKCFFKVIYIDEDNINAKRALGWCMMQTENYPEARKYFSLVVKNNSDNPYDYINMGHIHMLENNITEGINNYRIASTEFLEKEDIFQAIKEIKQFLSSHGVNKDYINILTDLIL